MFSVYVLHKLGHVADVMGMLETALERSTLLYEALDEAKALLEDTTPILSGTAQGGWYVLNEGPEQGSVANNTAYLPFAFTGTVAHDIPADGSPRHLMIGGDWVTGPVHHPGTQPNDALWGALIEGASRGRERLSSVGSLLQVRLGQGLASYGAGTSL